MKRAKGKAKPRSGESNISGSSRNGISAGTKILAAEEATEILRAEGLESNQLTIRTYITQARKIITNG